MDVEWSMKLLKTGFKELSVVEWIRYPLFTLWIVLLAVMGSLLVADFLASKKSFFNPLVAIKNKIYSTLWASLVLGIVTLAVSFLLFWFPAGALSGFFGDLLPAVVGLLVGIYFFIDIYVFSRKKTSEGEDALPPSKWVHFLVNAKTMFGFGVLGFVVLHFFFASILFL